MSALPLFEELEHKVKDMRGNSGFELSGWPLFIAGLVVLFVVLVFAPSVILPALAIAVFLSPLWLPLVIVGAAFELWLDLRRSQFIFKQDYIVLEIKPPRSIVKTPLAMEAVFSGLHLSPGESTWYKKYVRGAVRPWWSLEIASIEGQVRFFIWSRAGFRRTIESQIYAQYPGAQVVEAPDYTKLISAHHDEYEIWGCDFTETKAGPFPIRTYIDYGLDKIAEEPEQVDPLASVLEFMGSLGKGEYMWLQFGVRVHKGEKYHKTNEDGKAYTWKDEAKELIQKIRKDATLKTKRYDEASGKIIEVEGHPNPTKGQVETIAAIERNISKLAFDVGARVVYLGTPGHYSGTTVPGIIGLLKQFNSEQLNGFKPTDWMTKYDDYPWERMVDFRKNRTRKHLVEAYRRRSFFHQPYVGEYMTMSTEELATIYHLPSAATQTPGLLRQQSSTSEAPNNLPT